MIHYREDFGLWWPDFDQKEDRNHAFILAHLVDMDFAVSHAKKGLCVQAGGNVGIWPMTLANHFEVVHTFEPEEALFQCMQKNIKDQNVILHKKGLSNKIDKLPFHRSSSCGSNKVTPEGKLTIDVVTIDSLNLPACDAILLDIEGHELQAIQGALATIEKYRPVIQIEWLKHYEAELASIDRILKGLGYKDKHKSGRDMVYLP